MHEYDPWAHVRHQQQVNVADLGELTDPHTGDKYTVVLRHANAGYQGFLYSPVEVRRNGASSLLPLRACPNAPLCCRSQYRNPLPTG